MSITTETPRHDIFISYRRDGGDVLARLLYETLTHMRYSVFLDYKSLHSGVYKDEILESIQNVKDVIVVLPRNGLERCKDPEDLMGLEISKAIKCNKNIIPVFLEGFENPAAHELLQYPQDVQDLLNRQGYAINMEHYDSTVNRICDQLNSAPRALNEADIAQTVNSLMNGGINNLSAKTKSDLVTEALSSSYGRNMANIMSSFIESNIGHYNNTRTHFSYMIKISNRFPFNNVDIDEKNYFKLSENLSYKKQITHNDMKSSIWISFIRDLDKLDDSLRDESFLFSENLLINNEDFQKLVDMSDEKKEDFYCKNMHTKININGKVLSPKTVIIDDAGIFANYDADEIDLTNRNILDVRVAFSVPHRKTSSYFFAAISDPTYSPYIQFVYPEDEFDVNMIPFMNRATTAANTKIFEGFREISFENEWVLPMSGAMFIITPRQTTQYNR